MLIGIDIDNTLTDTNYTLIDILNRERERSNQISYEDFDAHLIRTVWQHPSITAREYRNQRMYEQLALKEMNMTVYVLDAVEDLLLEHEIHIYSERPIEEMDAVKRFLFRKGFPIYNVIFHFGVKKAAIQKNLLRDGIEVYVDDNPNVIKRITNKEIIPIICSHPYNETCYNYMRLECFSLLTTLLKRAEETLNLRKEREFLRAI